ncbi:MAG: YSC84-related protein [Pseudomonadales bacterium]
MKHIAVAALSALLFILPLTSQAGMFGKDDPEKERKELREARTNAIAQLTKEKPGAQGILNEAKGYATFSSLGINLFVVATERGGGILHDNGTGKDTYMKMFSAGGGIGLGVKDFNLVFVFHTAQAMKDFRSEGWDFSGKAEGGAESGEKGMGAEAAATVVPGTTIYQMTDAGLSLQATLQGTKFWANDDLN